MKNGDFIGNINPTFSDIPTTLPPSSRICPRISARWPSKSFFLSSVSMISRISACICVSSSCRCCRISGESPGRPVAEIRRSLVLVSFRFFTTSTWGKKPNLKGHVQRESIWIYSWLVVLTCFNHLEKYESQWEGWHPIYLWKIKHVPNHQPDKGI